MVATILSVSRLASDVLQLRSTICIYVTRLARAGKTALLTSLAAKASRKVGIPFACRFPLSQRQHLLTEPQAAAIAPPPLVAVLPLGGAVHTGRSRVMNAWRMWRVRDLHCQRETRAGNLGAHVPMALLVAGTLTAGADPYSAAAASCCRAG